MKEIPHIIHYCWFGRNKKPALITHCINSWRKYLPDWEIIEWNEDNYNVNKDIYIKEAYQCKKWAFVADYARFDILNKYGGIYFDTDVELLKVIPTYIIKSKGFTCMEDNCSIAPGLVLASLPNEKFLTEMINIYKKMHFYENGIMNQTTVCEFMTDLFMEHGFVKTNKTQTVYGIEIYPSDYFCSWDKNINEPLITQNSISVHHYFGSWKRKGFKSLVKKYIKKYFGLKVYRMILNQKNKRKVKKI